jgi:hypothetical protein
MLATYKHNLLTTIVVKSHTGKFLCLQSTNLQSTEKDIFVHIIYN